MVASTSPQIIERYPVANETAVVENPVITLKFFSKYDILDPTKTIVWINNEIVYDGSVGFTAGYAGSTQDLSTVFVLQFTKINGFSFGEKVTVRAYIEDTNTISVDQTWSWQIRKDTSVYDGIRPLAIETAIQQPLTTALELELFRQIFLNNALRVQTRSTDAAGNKAARVLYQTAFATELSTLQNAFALRDENALAVTVAERQSTRVLDNVLSKYRDRIPTAISSMQTLGILPEAYTSGFRDYLDSALYVYRVSLVANMLLYAKAYELQRV
jgi:hypothetical protein